MAKERGIFKIILKSFVSSFMPRFSRPKLMGEDYHGTKYYEQEVRYSSRQRPPRYFVPVNKDDFEQEMPAEWEAWLRYRRNEPPTREEIEANYQLAIDKKTNAVILEEKYSKDKSTKEHDVPSTSQPVTSENFPVYEEYKDFGRKYKRK